MKSWGIVVAAGLVIALPFIFRRPPPTGAWEDGDPVLVVISPHNEAIRYEFARGFSAWRQRQGKSAVKVDWRIVGGTSEISKYLNAELLASFKFWWQREGNDWPSGGTRELTNRRFSPEGKEPNLVAAREALLSHDDPDAFGTGLDLFFGGGVYDHSKAAREGLTVAPWPNGIPEDLVRSDSGTLIFPEGMSGEEWRSPMFIGTALSTFGIVSNLDRLEDVGVSNPPTAWEDLANPAYFRELGVSDPTKSGSISKAFEMLIHQQIHQQLVENGFSPSRILELEKDPEAAPKAYHEAISQGWVRGLNLVRRIGANARYFTDSASKVPIDVSMGNATVGIAIDFYGRYQAETSRGPDGMERMIYTTPVGGSSVSADPVSVLRGAPNRELAVEFIEYVISEEGQKLWNYRPGTEGGPEKFALRRLPIRRDFYPSDDPEIQAAYESHAPFTSDPLGDDSVNPYYLASRFQYIPRWTARRFGIHRYLIRAMAMDAAEELTAAWVAIQEAGGPEAVPDAMEALLAFPPGLSWETALDPEYAPENQMTFMRNWILFFRAQYEMAKNLAENSDA